MINVLKKYWFLILIILIIVNVFGFHLLGESLGISDALEHLESDEVIKNLKRKDFFYTVFIDFFLIIDFWIILFVPYLVIRNIVGKIKCK
ncbi:hypothetical protein [Chryseobacterium polytrichastri]|uniref:Uncharacterized protein n=1 Tax=Chryseobacterium polytrichastri TaxID=1302687 RepID=A0A1M7GYY8_9FLAO|nr:hypothetical protein [Chryseobacterium polytrichastri]SHM21378.1 hypothetical protein SAMN05444267_103823 [Chryseobacterium polytrichastri]